LQHESQWGLASGRGGSENEPNHVRR
jgi:hypothetical protein